MAIMRVRTTISGSQGLPGVFTMYFNGSTTSPSSGDAADVCARVRTFLDAIKTVFPNTTTLQVLGTVDTLLPADGQLITSLAVTPPASVAGTSPSALPAATAILLQHNTGVIVNGRRIRGRSFLSPTATAVMTSGLPSAAISTTITTAANVMITGATSSAPVVWSRPLPLGAGAGFATPTTAFAVGTQFAVLRSRRD